MSSVEEKRPEVEISETGILILKKNNNYRIIKISFVII